MNKIEILENFEYFKGNELETDLQKLIDLYIMSKYYDIVDELEINNDFELELQDNINFIENTIKEYYNS